MIAWLDRMVRAAVVPVMVAMVALIGIVTMLLVGVGSSPSATQSRVSSVDATPSQQPLVPGLEPFVGSWFGHARGMTIDADGHTSYAGRVFQWCGVSVRPPCDDNFPIVGGLSEELVFTRVSGATAYGTIASGTDDPGPQVRLSVGDQVTVSLEAQGKLAVSDGWELCGPHTPPGDPTCSGA